MLATMFKLGLQLMVKIVRKLYKTTVPNVFLKRKTYLFIKIAVRTVHNAVA